MKNSKIFLVAGDTGGLTQMTETTYVTEDVLQAYLANYPDLLPGDQINPDSPRRWLLVTREMGVPGDETETGRWSLDHLFLDQEGIPTFVECKRSSDTRVRREVVAQMLDYAANGVEYWSIGSVREAALRTHGEALDDEVIKLIGQSSPEALEKYWKDVERNLHAHVIRLIFVADELPAELRRLIEFLNEQMTDVEVLGVEIRQYTQADSNQTALVPRVVGATETARAVKETQSGSRARTNRQAFLAKCAPPAAEFFTYMLKAAEERGHVIYWGSVGFSTRAHLPEGGLATFAYGYPQYGAGAVARFEFTSNYLPLSNEARAALRARLLTLSVLEEGSGNTLSKVIDQDAAERMSEVFDLILDQVDEIVRAQN